MIKSFTPYIDQAILDELKSRIITTRWPDEIENSDWSCGTNLSYLKELADYWVNKFSWRDVETEINSFPNFIADIDGYKIHFLHIKGNSEITVPLIMTHGWPGSFIEMLKIIPLLTNPKDFSFDLVIPSIPGFGFSEKITHSGCSSSFVAGLWQKLMTELGYKKYGAQGGDIGAGISTWLSLKYPENIMGLHLNYIPGSYEPYDPEGEALSEDVGEFQTIIKNWSESEGAYAHLHRTKPLSLAYALNDSPVGLCSWIIEKFNSWSDNKGNLENVFTKNELLSNVTLYWVTQTIHSSIRIYKENNALPLIFGKDDFVKVPVGFAKFPKELPTPPRSYIEKGFNIKHWTVMPKGGHFAAFEQPVLLANDIRDFFKEMG